MCYIVPAYTDGMNKLTEILMTSFKRGNIIPFCGDRSWLFLWIGITGSVLRGLFGNLDDGGCITVQTSDFLGNSFSTHHLNRVFIDSP